MVLAEKCVERIRSARSPSTNSPPSTASRWPVERLSKVTTSHPRRSRCLTMCEPIYPAPPTTSRRSGVDAAEWEGVEVVMGGYCKSWKLQQGVCQSLDPSPLRGEGVILWEARPRGDQLSAVHHGRIAPRRGFPQNHFIAGVGATPSSRSARLRYRAIFTTTLRTCPSLTSGACASSGKKMQNDPAGVATQLDGRSSKKRMSLSTL
jgi:hypothetical protein